MRAGSMARWAFATVVALGLWLGSAGSAGAEAPSPSPTEAPSSNPFADLQPVSLLMWLGSALIALVAVLYAVERERRKHDG